MPRVTGELLRMDWVVLTMGNRPDQLAAAVASLTEQNSIGDEVGESLSTSEIVVVANGAGRIDISELPFSRLLVADQNLGVPGGRDLGLASCSSEVVGFLDDDAELRPGGIRRIVEAFEADPRLGAVSLRIVDELGETARRHIPRPGQRTADRSGEVALFLGGASAIRVEAYEQVGGYFTELMYGHEELELSWRLIDAGWTIRYLSDVEVFHPRSSIERHADGWELTGRNRVWIARRTLPWAVAVVHATVWLALGLMRAPGHLGRSKYLDGWRAGWRESVARRPIRWSTIWHLTRLGRPPII